MGYIRHDAIVVTALDEKYLKPALRKAQALALPVSGIVPGTTNGYCSFLIAPDGSKEGWGESDRCDEARKAWMDWAETAYKDGVYLEWAHLTMAGDEHSDTRIVRQAGREE